MYLEAPRRDLTLYIEGRRSKPPAVMQVNCQKDAHSYVRAYYDVVKRDNRTCANCQKDLLHAPNIKLGIVDPDKYLYDASNMITLCPRCCARRESRARLAADNVTGLVHNTVLKREGHQCIYCLTKPLRPERAEMVPRIDKANELEPADWAAACRTCANDRGSLTHAQYLDKWRRFGFELIAHHTAELDNE